MATTRQEYESMLRILHQYEARLTRSLDEAFTLECAARAERSNADSLLARVGEYRLKARALERQSEQKER